MFLDKLDRSCTQAFSYLEMKIHQELVVVWVSGSVHLQVDWQCKCNRQLFLDFQWDYHAAWNLHPSQLLMAYQWSAAELCSNLPSLWTIVPDKIAWKIDIINMRCTQPRDVCRKPLGDLGFGLCSLSCLFLFPFSKVYDVIILLLNFREATGGILSIFSNWNSLQSGLDTET